MDRKTTILAVLLKKGSLTGPELLEETGIPSTPFYGHLRGLRKEGLVRRTEDERYELVFPGRPEEELQKKPRRRLGFWDYRRLQFLERKAGQHARVRVIARVREALDAREPVDINAVAAEEYAKSRREILGKEGN